MLDVSRIQRTRRYGEATGDSFRDLMKSLSKLEEAFLPFMTLGTNVFNVVLTFTNGLLTNVLTGIKDFIEDWTGWDLDAVLDKGDKFADPTRMAQMDFLNSVVMGQHGGNVPHKKPPAGGPLGAWPFGKKP